MKKTLFLFSLLLTVSLCYSQFDATRKFRLETRSTGRIVNPNAQGDAQADYSTGSTEWNIIENADGTYRIRNVQSSKVLGAKGGAITGNTVIDLQTWSSVNTAQKWQIVAVGSYYKITNLKSGLALSALNELPTTTAANPDITYFNSFSAIASIVQKTYNYSTSMLATQQFRIVPVKYEKEEGLIVPQLGWTNDAPKTAIYISNTNIAPPSFQLKRISDQAVVRSGTMVRWTTNTTWGQFYYTANLSSFTQSGNFILECKGYTSNVTINNDIYSSLKSNNGGVVDYSDLFNGFWKYNKFYTTTHNLPKANYIKDVNLVSNNTGNYAISRYGWFDAHSHDSKTARTAKAVADLCLAVFNTNKSVDRTTLKTEIIYGLQYLLDNQNANGSWHNGKVRESVEPRKFYFWTQNIDVNSVARCVKALAMGYQVFKKSDYAYAVTLKTAAENGWAFVIANEALVDNNLDLSWRGHTVDIVTAAIEMAIATNEATYFNKADSYLNIAGYTNGIFRRVIGTPAFPCETGNRYSDLDDGSLPSLCRYIKIARTLTMKDRVRMIVNDYLDYWSSVGDSPFGFPQEPLDRIITFGSAGQVARLAFNMFGIADATGNAQAQKYGEAGMNYLLGLNPFGDSYIVGLGDSDKTSSLSFFKRGFEDGIGSILPGCYFNGTTQVQEYNTYQATEGVVPVNSALYYMLSSLDNNYNKSSTTPYNGDMELGATTSWSLTLNNSAAANLDDAQFIDVFNDLRSAKVDVNVLPSPLHSNVRLVSIPINFAGTSIEVNVKAKALKNTGSDFKIAIIFYNASNQNIGSYFSPLPLALTNIYANYNCRLSGAAIPTGTKKVTVELRCGNGVDTYFFDDITVGAPSANRTLAVETNETDSEIAIYPNPVKDILKISDEAISKITFVSMDGRVFDFTKIGDNLSVSSLPNGVYLAVLKDKNGEILSKQKIIKQ